MTFFKYRGKKTNGETIVGQVEARSQDEAVEIISRQGILPIAIEQDGVKQLTDPSRKRKNISSKEIYIFTRQLSNLLKSGVPLLRAMEIIRGQLTNRNFSDVLSTIHQKVKEGKSLSECLLMYPKIFSSLYVAMVRAGEEGGDLPKILNSLSSHQKAQQELLTKVKMALVYPLFMASVGLATVLFILLFVMPRITGLFLNIGQDLPLLTKILIGLSTLLLRAWFIVLPATVLVVFSLIRWGQSKVGSRALDGIKLKIPVFGLLIQKTEFTRFTKTLELLLHNGISLIKALQISVATVSNELMRDDLAQCRASLEAGQTLGQSFEKCQFIPVMVVQLIKVGEESGQLEDSLLDISQAHEQEVSDATKTLTTILEPVMILAVGAVVGLMIVAMLLPIFQMDILVQ